MQLLAVGRSIGTITDEPSRYKMTQQRLLPRFGPLKEGDGACCMEPPPVGEEAAAAVYDNAVLPLGEPSETHSAPAGQVTPAGSRTEPAQPITQAVPLEQSINTTERVSGRGLRKVASPWRGWSLLGNPFKSVRRPVRHSGPVQGELALDMIRPVCNDLNDTDLEIVTVRTKPVQRDGASFSPGSGRTGQSVGALWDRLRMVLSRFRVTRT